MTDLLLAMAQAKPAVAMVSDDLIKCETGRMNVCSIPSVQRVVNFTDDDGKMYLGEHFRGTVPEATMICDLPLLFVNGLPTSLEHLSLEQLLTFVPYMIECSTGSCFEQNGKFCSKPKWWPHDVEFSVRPQKPPDMTKCKWLAILQNIVSCCYSYHGCEFALKLKSSLKQGTAAWPYNIEYSGKPISKVSDNLRASSTSCYGLNLPLNRIYRRSKDSDRNQNTEPHVHKSTCDSKVRKTEEIKCEKYGSQKQKPIFSRTQENMMCVGTLRERLSVDKLYNRNVRDKRKVLYEQSLPLNCDPSMLNNTLPANLLNMVQPNVDIKWSPSVVLHDCFKSNFKYKRNFKPEKRHKTQSPRPNKGGLTNSNGTHSSTNTRKRIHSRKRLLPKDFYRNTSENTLNTELFEDIKLHDQLSNEDSKVEDSFLDYVNISDIGQENFMRYFDLIDTSNLNAISSDKYSKSFGNPLRYGGVPISSPLGGLIFKSRVSESVFLNKIEKVERYCTTTPVNDYRLFKKEPSHSVKWEISWKYKGRENWSHDYCYPIQRWWNTPKLWLEMKQRARLKSLLQLCKPCEVVVTRLTSQEIENPTLPLMKTLNINITKFQKTQKFPRAFCMAPKLKRLSHREILAYTNAHTIVPVLKRLTDHEIRQYRN